MKVTSANSRLAGDVGDDKWPPGFRFHPTDEELVLYYLKRKICKRRLRLDIIRVLDVYKWDPEELPGQSILNTGDRQWFFFTPRDRKYPNGGARSNRATGHGYWKATGKDRNIACNSRTVGIKKTLVFYRGRAPHGERTDWVMHEYTLDEEELKRCLNAQEYYALYKVYKKSGPGPKNGEQYGAPFKEEDWADDECAGAVTSVAPIKQQNVVTPPANNTKAIVPVEPPLTVEYFMYQTNKPPELPEIANYANGLQQVASEGEIRSTLIEPSCREAIYPEKVSISPTSNQQCEGEVNLGFNQSTASKIQMRDAAEVTSVPISIEGPLICEDDFLEIDDFIGPELTTSTSPDKPEENFCFDDFNGLSDFDLYHDADLFWNDMGPVGQEIVSHVSPVDSELLSHSLSNQIDYHLQPCSSLNQVDGQLHSHSAVYGTDYLQPHSTVSDVNYLQSSEFGTDQLWESYPRSDAFTSTELPQGTFTEAKSGVILESTNNLVVANQNQSGEEDVGSAGWFSSTLWAYVDSIPHTPASAVENPLVNKAFERMSSFSRIRMNYKNSSINGDDGIAPIRTANARKTVGSRGFLFLSVIGVLCAISWVLVGTVGVGGSGMS